MAAGRLAADRPFLTDPAPPAGVAAILRRGDAGACVFFEHDSRLCAVHRTLGDVALPSACRIFPRIALTDARGTFITLSHFCPTAASMLFRTEVPLEIVESPPAFPPGDYDGLNAAGEWPPLLTPSVLMDLDAYSAWETRAVAVLANASSPEAALTAIREDVSVLTGDRVAPPPLDIDRAGAIHARVLACVPSELAPCPRTDLARSHGSYVKPVWQDCAGVVNRYLASHAFASWVAYQGRGLHSQVRSIEGALAVLMVECAWHCRDAGRLLDAELLTESIRSADLLLRHLADRQRLADVWSERVSSGL